MSNVTNAVLTWDIMEENSILEDVNAATTRECGQGFVSVKDPKLPKGWYGGSKYLEANIALVAFKDFGPSNILAVLRTVAWKHPENVRVMVKDHEDDYFSLHGLGE